MDGVATYPADERRELFRETATQMGIASLVIAEKDFWVCFAPFWEKATIFHAENHRPLPEGRAIPPAWGQLSRHAYDIVRMDRCGVAERALARPGLLAAVARHKEVFFYTRWARYAAAARGSFRLVPGEKLCRALRRDYGAMSSMIFREVPDFDEILGTLRCLEKRINGIR